MLLRKQVEQLSYELMKAYKERDDTKRKFDQVLITIHKVVSCSYYLFSIDRIRK
jgi:hypothetical protein